MSYAATATPTRRKPRPVTTEDQLRQRIAALEAELARREKEFDTIVKGLQEQHRMKVQQVVGEANTYIEAVEARANESITTSQQAQVDHDNEKLAAWAATCEILQAENEQLRARVAALEAQQPQQQPQPRKPRRTKLTAKERRALEGRGTMEGEE